MKDSVTASKAVKRSDDSKGSGKFQKVFDGRKQPIRGLWVRNDRFYARISVENPENGKKEIRRVPLEAHTVASARTALKRAPKFDAYVKWT